MSNVKWIKLSTHMFDDEKIRLIENFPEAETILVIWIKLLVQAGKANAGGYILLNENIPYSAQMLSTIFNRPLEVIEKALQVLEDYRMIEIDNNDVIFICNWEKHQNIEGMERIREQNRIRKKRERDRKKSISSESSPAVTRHVTHNHDAEIEKKEIEKEEEKNKKGLAVSYSNEFECFWSIYPRKVDKRKAYKSFEKVLKSHPLETVLEGVEGYSKQVHHIELKYIKHPATFLNNESFLDEFNQGENDNGKIKESTSFSKEYGLDF